jgi:hypothetical protein
MTIEADTLAQLTAKLRKQGKILFTEVQFIRAPYRHNHHWVCTVA